MEMNHTYKPQKNVQFQKVQNNAHKKTLKFYFWKDELFLLENLMTLNLGKWTHKEFTNFKKVNFGKWKHFYEQDLKENKLLRLKTFLETCFFLRRKILKSFRENIPKTRFYTIWKTVCFLKMVFMKIRYKIKNHW